MNKERQFLHELATPLSTALLFAAQSLDEAAAAWDGRGQPGSDNLRRASTALAEVKNLVDLRRRALSQDQKKEISK